MKRVIKTPSLKKQHPEPHSDRGWKIILGKYYCTFGPFLHCSLYTKFFLMLRGRNSCLAETVEVLSFGKLEEEEGMEQQSEEKRRGHL